MAITTLDQADAGRNYPYLYDKTLATYNTQVANRYYSTWYHTGNPGNPGANAAGLSGAALTSPVTGQLPIPPTSNNTYLHSITHRQPIAGAPGMALLVDRLWHNSGITITSTAAQTINSVTFPARDDNGTTNGDGVLVGVEVSTATGAGTPGLSMSYTDQAGTAGKTANSIITGVASSNVGSFYLLGLAAGDTGVRSIQNFTLSATWTSGTIHLVAFRILAVLPVRGVGVGGNVFDYKSMGLQRMYDESVPFILWIGGGSRTLANVRYTQG